ncbi:hypothetical protein CYMTET_50768 [Cymbomonas tetramitiformis]|uniref:Uncharacterized protein n=1 Tax=Cymbomonas tetramitiformis TaxID=36881 RepID=A0AAE0BNJ4_9CHLO|nr:hypothetical protein CYMTET_50768 [Cymbomonas tetramitiformis]
MSHFPGVDVHHVRGQDHLKQWNMKETRRRDRAAELDPENPQPSEKNHDLVPKALADYRKLSQQTRDAQEAAKKSNEDPIYDMSTPKLQRKEIGPKGAYPPHLTHHHHFGWGGPIEEQDLGDDGSTVSYHKYGNAVGYCENIHSTSALLSTRR